MVLFQPVLRLDKLRAKTWKKDYFSTYSIYAKDIVSDLALI
jgi:hypothetical protein